MKKISLITLAIIGFSLLSFIPVPTLAMTGNGTAANPFVIYNITDLQNVSNNTTACYEVANDIDASVTEIWGWCATRGVYEGFEPIPAFSGNFNGNYNIIDRLHMDRRDITGISVGLFASLTSNAEVGNVYITNANVTASAGMDDAPCYVGILFGSSDNSATGVYVHHVMTSGTVLGSHDDSGGVRLIPGAGGLVGGVAEGVVLFEQCLSTATVNFSAYQQAIGVAGGFVGMMYTAGVSDIDIVDCYAKGDVYCWYGLYPAAYSGGFCGYRYGDWDGLAIGNSYSTGAVWSEDVDTGGFIAFSSSPVVCNCITASFWDTQTSGTLVGVCGDGKNTTEMKTQFTFTSAGWNFTGVWDMAGAINDGYPYFEWWYTPSAIISDINQVLWFQPNDIIHGTTLPDRATTDGTQNGIITWGANPAGITMSYGEFVPEEEYEFEPIIPDNPDIIKPEPEVMTGDVDLEALHNNPFYPLVQILSIDGFLNERLVWLGLAWLIVIVAMLGVHLGFDTKKNTEKPQHFILTTITGLGLSILFYSWSIFPLWVVILMSFGLVGAIIWERQPVI